MKGELEALGEEYENVESISKIQTQILNQTNGAVNIFDKNGNFKSTYEILKGISKVWSDISQVDQAALLMKHLLILLVPQCKSRNVGWKVWKQKRNS